MGSCASVTLDKTSMILDLLSKKRESIELFAEEIHKLWVNYNKYNKQSRKIIDEVIDVVLLADTIVSKVPDE